MTSDFIIEDHGTIVTFIPWTPAAKVWWDENCDDGPSLGRSKAVDHRYAQDIIDGIDAAGFTIN